MIAADELIERCQLARNTSDRFGIYPVSTHPQNRSALSLLQENNALMLTLISDLGLRLNHGMPA